MNKKFSVGNVISKSFVGHMTNKVLGPVEDALFETIRNKVLYTIEITREVYGLRYALAKLFPDMTDLLQIKYSSDFEKGYRVGYTKGFTNFEHMSAKTSSVVRYKGTPVFLSVNSQPREDRRRPNDVEICISTIKTKENIKNLRQLIEKMVAYNGKASRKTWPILQVIYGEADGRGYNEYIEDPHFRTFNDVFITDEQQRLLTSSLDSFVKRHDWYIKNSLPYHFGILLYGQPGSGKSSLAQAIADHLKARMYVISGDQVLYLSEYIHGGRIPRETSSKDLFQVVLIEDIDCGFEPSRYSPRFGMANTNDDKNERVNGLASLLNSIDGITSPSNTVFIFTTNHIEKLDPALIRPGRIDLKLEIGGVNNETLNKFCIKHYGRTIPDDLTIKDGLTFAELQVYIMKNTSFDELIDIVKAD